MLDPKILIAEDDNKITELLIDYLVQSGFKVKILHRGDRVLSEVQSNPLDLVILDIMLPGKDGMTICQEIRSFSNVPILMLSAKGEEIDRLLGLEVGADDYICKPFSPREVVSRIKGILRRVKNDEPYDTEIVAGPITIEPENYNVKIEGKKLHLTPVEFNILSLLASYPNSVIKRSDFISNLQGKNFAGSERIIDSHIKNLRKKIDNILPGNNLIQTVYGMGYSLNIPVADN